MGTVVLQVASGLVVFFNRIPSSAFIVFDENACVSVWLYGGRSCLLPGLASKVY